MAGPIRLLAIGQLALIAVTWKLWTPQTVFPQVPLIRAACDWPGWLDWTCLTTLIASSVTLAIVAKNGWMRRAASGATAISWAGFFILNQHRLQPWAWQFFLLAFLLSLADDTNARRGWIWLSISIYFWSSVSKFDFTFCHEQGPALLTGLKRAIGIRVIPNQWTEIIDVAGAFCLALGELAIALMLAWPRSRWVGLWLAIIMHVALLVALGPMGLNHSWGVLVWNVFFIAQDCLLFWNARAPTNHDIYDSIGHRRMRFWEQFQWPPQTHNRAGLLIILAAIAWPALEPIGLCDHWLAWSVYSARAGKAEIVTTEFPPDRFPPKETAAELMSPSVGFSEGTIMVAPLDIAGWCLGELGVPVYPEHRFQVAVAGFSAERFGFHGGLILYQPRNRWNGEYGQYRGVDISPVPSAEFSSLEDSFFWNARPRWSPNSKPAAKQK